MKMTQMLWRVASLWLCVGVVCRYPSCYVGCTELDQEPQRSVSSSDIEEEPREKPHHHAVEENSASLTHPLSEIEQLLGDDQQKEEQTIPQEDKKDQYPEVFGVDDVTVNVELEADKEVLHPGPGPDHGSEMSTSEVFATQEQESSLLTAIADPVSGFTTEDKDSSAILSPQDDIPNSFSHDAPDVAPTEVLESDLPPAECEEETNPFDNDSNPPVVLENTSNPYTPGTKTHPDPPPEADQYLEAPDLSEQDVSSPVATDTDSSVSAKDPEDIPTFDEWKRKMMEVEKEKTQSTHSSSNGGSHVVKKVQKNFNNYASVECGAKILGANPEAKSTSAILKENMDVYMLNPCSHKIWFIIELCEPIQVKQLDIANFELFSSTPKDFLVSISDRYPTNKWLKLGTFHARDERTVQSFPLDEHLYAKYVKMFTKYIKVELISHFGSEHFCPLSLIRVFGTSMVEEYEEIADPSERPEDSDDELDYPPGYTPGEVKYPNNLIGSAKDVILNMVSNIAVNVLGGGPEMQGNLSSQEVNQSELSSHLETTPPTISDPLSVSDLAEADVSLDSEIHETGVPPSEPSAPEALTPHPTDQDLSSVEEKIVFPLEKDEEPVTPTIILLDVDEELEEGKEKKGQSYFEESSDYCAFLPLFSSTCSCAASLREYLQQQCSVHLFKQRKCQTKDRAQRIPSVQAPSWHPLLPTSACPEPTQQRVEVHEKEQAFEQEPDSAASPSEASQPPEAAAESLTESMSDPTQLEPSQTSNLPKPSATDLSFANPTTVLETPQLSTDELAKPPWPESGQDVLTKEKHISALVPLSSSIYAKPSAIMEDSVAAPAEEKPAFDLFQPDINTLIPIPDMSDQSHSLPPSAVIQFEPHSDLPVVSESASTEPVQPAPDTLGELEPSGGPAATPDTKMEDQAEDLAASLSGNGQGPRTSSPGPPSLSSSSDIYAETPNGTEQIGNLVHGSSQKESVFMRLNNRIKALEMNMSLSGRYLEQLSQRYRKQMEEMQKAFNKTIIKLQNTSRIAEEQDQRQTESIQLLQGQLENVTQLVLNLSLRVSELQNEVSDRQSYLLLSLLVCLCFGLVLFANRIRFCTVAPTAESDSPTPTSYSYCCPERDFSSCEETGLKRSVSYPLIHSESLKLVITKDPDILHSEETLCPANRKKRRRKMKPAEKVETLTPSLFSAPERCNGAVVCNGIPVNSYPKHLAKHLLHPTFRDSPSEGSSEGSSHSDDPSFCGITTACSRICDGLPPPKNRAEKRALRRRRPKPSCAVVDYLQAPRRDNSQSLPIATIHDIMNRKTEQSSGTLGVKVAYSGPV